MKLLLKQIKDFLDDAARHERDSKFYYRLLVQAAMANGGTLVIDPAFGEKAIKYAETGTVTIGDGKVILNDL
jgi:hypothetical protein